MRSDLLKSKLRAVFFALSLASGMILGSPALHFEAAFAQSQTIIHRVVFENNKKVTDEQLTQAIESKPQTAFKDQTAAADVERLRQAYARAGRSAASITYRTVPLDGGGLDLVFTVAEGDKIGVDEIVFVGNDNFSAYRLKRQLATVESGWLSWLRTTDTYDPERIAGDEERLRRFYVNHGYPDFRVVSVVPTLNEKQDGYIITFNLEEGQYHTFGASTVESQI